MSFKRVGPAGGSDWFRILAGGAMLIPDTAMKRLKWSPGDRVFLEYKESEPTTLEVYLANHEKNGFRMSLGHRTGNDANGPVGKGGKITCYQFTRNTLAKRVSLPLHNLYPIFVENGGLHLAIILEQISWIEMEFSKAEAQKVPTDIVGVYQILSGDGKVIKIGEGVVRKRTEDHLKDEALAKAGRSFRYFRQVDKDESARMERILLAEHEQIWGCLPQFNMRRS